MNNKLFISCVESRIEQDTNWYSRFEIGPFQTGQALTVANSLRRTLLATQSGVFLTAVEIEGAIHEYSRLDGIKESILDILLNLRQVSLYANEEMESQETLVGYFDLHGPLEVKAKHLKFPKKLECGNPNQHIATLTRNCHFQGRFLITVNPNLVFKNHSIGDPVQLKEPPQKAQIANRFNETNWLYVNPITNAVRRVNYVVEQFGDVWEQKEVVVLEIWTNGTIHPKVAIQTACNKLSLLFASIASGTLSTFKYPSALTKFKKLKTETSSETGTFSKVGFSELNVGTTELTQEKLTILFDIDITNLNLSLKTYLALKTANIENIGNLFQYKKDELATLTKLSATQLEELDEALNLFGLVF